MPCHKFKMKLPIKNRENSIFYILLFIVLFIEFFYLKLQVGGSSHSIFYLIKSTLADSSLMMLFCLLLRNYWKYLTLLIPVIISFFAIINILYFRYFEELIPFSYYGFGGGLNNIVLKSALSVIIYWDVIIFAASLLPTLYVVVFLKNTKFISSKPGVNFIIADGIIILLSWFFSILSTNGHIKEKYPTYSFGDVLKSQLFSDQTSWTETFEYFHGTGYVVRGIIEDFFTKGRENLNEEGINEYLSNKGKHSFILDLEGTRPQNLIFIVVESLQSNVFENSNIDYIFPNLANLYNDSTTIHVDCTSLVGLGNSSDAQLMYNTGLLPLRNESFTVRYSQRNFPSLAKALGMNSLEIIGEKGNIWNHKFTTKSFGFDKLIDNVANWGTFNQDSLIFKEAEAQLSQLSQPFFLFITSLSMHPSYSESNTSHSLNPQLLDYTDKNIIEYFQRLNHFDTQLGIFFNFLKTHELYDNSLIVIVGDHPILDPDIPEYFKTDKVPALIVNSPKYEYRKENITQIDLFPTILDIFRKHCVVGEREYYGLGTSIFNPTAEYPSEKDYIISALLIKNNVPLP